MHWEQQKGCRLNVVLSLFKCEIQKEKQTLQEQNRNNCFHTTVFHLIRAKEGKNKKYAVNYQSCFMYRIRYHIQ